MEKRITSPLMEPSSIEKIVEIDAHIGKSFSGGCGSLVFHVPRDGHWMDFARLAIVFQAVGQGDHRGVGSSCRTHSQKFLSPSHLDLANVTVVETCKG